MTPALRGRLQLAAVLLLLQAGFSLVMALGMLVIGILALHGAIPSALVALLETIVIVVLAALVLRGGMRVRWAIVILQTVLAVGGLLSLLIKPDLLALLADVVLPGVIAGLVLPWPAAQPLSDVTTRL